MTLHISDMSPERIAEYEKHYTHNLKSNVQDATRTAHESLRKGNIHFTHKIKSLTDKKQLGIGVSGDLDLMLAEYQSYTSVLLEYLRQLHDYGDKK